MASQQELTYNSLIAMHVTKFHGNPEPEDLDQLEEELCVIATSAKTTHFTQGLKFGHLAMILTEAKYRAIISVDPMDVQRIR